MQGRRTDEWGRVIFDSASLIDLILNGKDLSSVFAEDTPLLAEYNEWCRRYDKTDYLISTPEPLDITPEEEHRQRAETWFIKSDIQAIDVRKFLLEQLCKDDICRERVNLEMDLFEQRGLVPLLQLMLFLVDHFRTNKIVWGVGRGSSVASYCLYLIGVHHIDSLKYGLDVHDFLR